MKKCWAGRAETGFIFNTFSLKYVAEVIVVIILVSSFRKYFRNKEPNSPTLDVTSVYLPSLPPTVIPVTCVA